MAPLPKTRLSILEQLFSPVASAGGQKRLNNYSPKRGTLISFSYAFWRNDPNPLVIVVNNEKTSDKISGINLHRLTMTDIGELVRRSGRMDFSYRSLADRQTFKDAYRSYKRAGMRVIRTFDSRFLLRVINMIRSYDPADIEIMRRQVQEQIMNQINPKAEDLTNLSQKDTDAGVNG